MFDVLAQYQPRVYSYPNRVRESIANLVSYASRHSTSRRQESVPLPQKIDLSVPVIDEEKFRYWRTSLPYHAIDKTRDTMTLEEFAEIVGYDTANKVRYAYEREEINRLNTWANFGHYFTYLEFPSNGNGPGVKLTYVVLNGRQNNQSLLNTSAPTSFTHFLLEYFKKLHTKKQKL